MKEMIEPGVMPGKPVEAVEKSNETKEETLTVDETTIDKAVEGSPTAEADKALLKADVLHQTIEDQLNKVEQQAATQEKEVVLDVSALKSHIEALESKKAGMFNFGRKAETIRRLTESLRKIDPTNPKYKPEYKIFSNRYMAALKQGGEKLAFEYAEAIGNGELVEPRDGVLMTTDKRSDQKWMPR